MKLISSAFVLFALCGVGVFAADTEHASMGPMYDRELSMVEREVVSLAEAMPSDKYGFAPTHGDFKGVRTFGQQMSHIATVIYEVSAGVLGEKSPVDAGKSETARIPEDRGRDREVFEGRFCLCAQSYEFADRQKLHGAGGVTFR